MNKKGQFYLIIALILSLAVYGVTYKVNKIEEPILFEDFNDVSQNYLTESVYVINNALKNEEDVTIKLDAFTITYLDYAQQRNPDLTLLYIYGNGTNVSIQSYLDASGSVQGHTILGANQELVQGITIKVGGKEFIYEVPVTSDNFGEGWNGFTLDNQPFDLSVGGIVHPFDLSSGAPEFKVIVRTDSGEQEYTSPGSGEWEPLLAPGNTQQFVG